MTNQLLQEVIHHLKAIPEDQWHRVAVIFPGRRAGLLFKRALAAQISQPVFAPAVLSLPDLLQNETGWQLIDPVQLQFELFAAYRQLVPDEPFEAFIKWAPEVLRDFSEVDAYLLDADQVFGYLSREKAIDLWDPGASSLSQSAERYLAFFSRLGSLYHLLKTQLSEQQVGWQSMLARHWVEALEAEQAEQQYSHYLFAGFNALNKAETAFIKALLKAQKATVLFEADPYYLGEEHEAGLFLRQYREDPALAPGILYNGRLHTGDTRIEVVEAMGPTAQIQFAAEQINQWLEAGVAPEACVVVLANEKMLVPLLSALPESLQRLNISLGYPLEAGHAYQLLLAHLQLCEQGHTAFYFNDLQRLLQNPLFNDHSSQSALQTLLESGMVRFTAAQLQQLLGNHYLSKAGAWDETAAGPAHWLERWQTWLSALAPAGDDLQRGMCLQMITLLRRLESRLTTYPELNQWSLFRQLFVQLVRQEKVAFLGEPFQGLQIMGLLETRGLAFEKVLMIGVNEGQMPAAMRQEGYITYTLRYQFELPGPREKEAVFAYHFYRLLQHAEQAVLLCNGQTDDLGQGEPSRYLAQLKNEWPGIQKGHFSYRQLALPPYTKAGERSITIAKNSYIRERLRKVLEKPLSPTALTTYLSCSLRFYYARVLYLQSPQTVQETLEANELGTLLHRCLELMYAPLNQQLLTTADVDRLLAQYPQVFEQVVNELFPHRDFNNGMNLLLREVCLDYLRRFLLSEKTRLANHQVRVLEQERVLEAALNMPDGQIMRLKGVADRLEECDGQLRIIDYKTGNFDKSQIKIDSADDLRSEQKQKAFQLLSYVWLYQQQADCKPGVRPEAGILSFRKLNEGEGMLHGALTENHEEMLAAYEALLQEIWSELHDGDRAFTQTENLETCKSCDFASICNRP